MQISKHAKERYAERIRHKSETADIAQYIALNEDTIRENIEKMVKYGDVIYDGESAKQKGKRVKMYLKDMWVIITDPEYDTVVTLYKIDLGLSDEFNKMFVEEVVKKAAACRERYEEAVEQEKEEREAYQEKLDENEARIEALRKTVKDLEKQNTALRDLMTTCSVNARDKMLEWRDAAMLLTSKTAF